MTDITQSPGDRLRFEILLKSLTEGAMNLAVLIQHDMVLDFYGNLFDERLRAKGETDVEFCFSTNSETLVQKFNEILSDLTLNEALEKEKKSAARRYLIFRDSILMQDFELQLLARLVNGFPASNITVILLINSAGNYRSKLEAFGKNLLQWEVETKAGDPKQPLEDWVAETKEPEIDDIAPASKLLNVQAKPSWRIPGFGNDKKEPVMEAVVPTVAATSVAPESSSVSAIPTLQDTSREPSLFSADSTADDVDQTSASTIFEKPQRSFPWGWVLLALLLSGAAFAYMHRDLVVDEIEQFKKYLLRGTPAVAMTPEDVASAEAAAKAAAEAASAAAQAQSQAQVASEPQAVASAIGTSASEASSKDVLPATAPPATNSAASAPLSVASAPAVSAPESTSKEVKDTKANRSKKSDDLSDEAWVKQLTDSSYVLQLSAADTEEDILKFKNSHPIYAKARVMSAPKKDSKKHYFILVAGPFENKTDADSYVNSHPLLSKGWLRNAKSMRNQFLRTQP